MRRASGLRRWLPLAAGIMLMMAAASVPAWSAAKSRKAEPVAWEFAPKPAVRASAQAFLPKRDKPVFTGEFTVDLVFITFPDCQSVNPDTALADLNRMGGMTIADYYKEYSQNITWPALQVLGKPYMAPQPLGYYCWGEQWANRLGWGGGDDGGARVGKLYADALAYARRTHRAKPGERKGQVTCYVHCVALDPANVEKHVRKYYQKAKPGQGDPNFDPLPRYAPPIRWADPLWPNSIPQITYPADGGVLVHELGHVLGAPDFYHATEPYDGLPGVPSLPWAYGPTGPAYCRGIYQAFVPKSAYPTVAKSGSYVLAPRRTNPVGDKVLGYFIPSTHPNYLFYVEYVEGEKAPLGNPGEKGLLIHVINVTMSSPMQGPPDLCYTYRPDDPNFLALNGDAGAAFFREGAVFDAQSTPKALLPNQMPAGIAIRNILFTTEGASFDLTVEPLKFGTKELADQLLPKIELDKVDELLPTSFRAHATMVYRGEPLNNEYGFCYDTSPKPTIAKKKFPLYHRDRYDGRILGLLPKTTYYVRAYVKNANGITYSPREEKVTLPPLQVPESVPPLLTDNFAGNFEVTKWHFLAYNGVWDSANSILALISLSAYYRVLPAAPGTKSHAVSAAQAAKQPGNIDMTRVHTNPSSSRPAFRMGEFAALHGRMAALADASGLRNKDFGDKKATKLWLKKFTETLKPVKGPKNNPVLITSSTITEYETQIRQALTLSQPVMVIRESTQIMPDTEHWHPLDTVLIDGFRGDGEYHMVFPCGRDRAFDRGGGYYPLSVLFDHTTTVYLFFYPLLPPPPTSFVKPPAVSRKAE